MSSRPQPVPIRVVATERLSERARRITFDGMVLVRSGLPASYLSLWFSDPAAAKPRADRRDRLDKRTMTPRWIDRAATTMTIDFVLHGSGPASEWAAAARLGDAIWAGETKGGYVVPPPGSHVVLVGDDTAIPAIGSILEALDGATRPTTVIEVVDGLDERTVSETRPTDPMWLHRGPDPSQAGVLTMNLIETLTVPDDAYWWIAGERDAIRAMRDVVVGDRGVPRDRLSLNAHWRLRATDPR